MTSPATVTAPTVTPTVAETGIPVVAGASGPGPATGSLHDIQHSHPVGTGTAQGAAPGYETAEEEKRRLAAAYSQSAPTQGQYSQAPPAFASGQPAKYESAEEEKKRLEREERERLLGAGSSSDPKRAEKKDGDDGLPPYQDI